MTISPVSPSGPSSPSGSGSSSPSGSGSGGSVQDSLSPAQIQAINDAVIAIHVSLPILSIYQYSSTLGNAAKQFQDVIYANQQTSATSFNNFYNSAISQAMELNQALTAFPTIITTLPLITTAASNKTPINSATEGNLAYSTPISSQTQTIDTAINNYNTALANSSSDSAFTTAQTALNTAVTNYTTFITALKGIYAVVSTLLTNNFTLLQKAANQQDVLQAQQTTTGSVILPPAYIKQRTQATSSGGAGGAGMGVAIGTAPLDDPNITAILNNALATSVAAQSNINLDPQALKQFKQLILSILTQSGLASGYPLLNNLAQGGPPALANPPSLNINLATTSANLLAHATQTPDINDAVLNLLTESNPTASPSDLAATATQLTAGANLFLLQTGLSQIAQAAANPQLAAQLAGTLDNAAILQPSLTSSQQLSLSDVLQNQYSVGSVLQFLITQFNAPNTSSTTAAPNAASTPPGGIDLQAIISGVIQAATQKGEVSPQQLQTALQTALAQNGIDAQDAASIALLTTNFLSLDITDQTALNATPNSNILNLTAINSTLAALGINQGIAATGSKTSALLSRQQSITNDQLVAAIQDDLSDQEGITPNAALQAANQVVFGNVSTAKIPTPPSTQIATPTQTPTSPTPFITKSANAVASTQGASIGEASGNLAASTTPPTQSSEPSTTSQTSPSIAKSANAAASTQGASIGEASVNLAASTAPPTQSSEPSTTSPASTSSPSPVTPNINNNEVQTIITSVLNSQAHNNSITSQQLQTSIESALVQSGIDSQDAIAIANQASNYLNAEITGGYQLDAAVNPNTVNAASIAASLSTSFEPGGTSNPAITDIGTQIASQMNSDQLISNRQLRDAIAHDLIKQGILTHEALAAANSAVFGSSSIVPGESLTTLDALTASLGSHVAQILAPTLGATEAENQSQTVVAAVLGIRHKMDAQLNTLKASGNEKVWGQINDNNRDFFRPNVDLLTFNQGLTTPSGLCVTALWSQTTYSPSSYNIKTQKPLDIMI